MGKTVVEQTDSECGLCPDLCLTLALHVVGTSHMPRSLSKATY